MKSFRILNGKAYVVELPEGATNPIIDDYLLGFNLPAPVGWGDWAEESYDTVKLPPGNWRIVSTLADLTEDKALDLVDWYHVSDNMDLTATYAFKDYANGEDNAEDYWDEYMMDTALESFHSAIRASGWYLENPIARQPPLIDDYRNEEGGNMELFKHNLREWREAQSRTLNPELTLILERK